MSSSTASLSACVSYVLKWAQADVAQRSERTWPCVVLRMLTYADVYERLLTSADVC